MATRTPPRRNVLVLNQKAEFQGVAFIANLGSLHGAVFSIATLTFALGIAAVAAGRPSLHFNEGGRFKIVQFSDIHNGPDMDPRTTDAMNRILDSEKPDLVVLSGDAVSSGYCADRKDLEKTIQLLSAPMESRRIPWTVVIGNHDTDNLAKIGVTKPQMMSMYRRYASNLNPTDPKDVYGAGNGLLAIDGKDGKPAFGVWLIDSNAYAPETIAGRKLGGYDWIHTSQIVWYYQTSLRNEKRLGHKLPSLMFMHICLPEFSQLVAKGKIEGERNEPECPSDINSGMFAALLDRKDVLGVYVGHDHTNMYEGDYYGIKLGYGGSVGYVTYGIDSKDEKIRNRTRGGRVFEIDESGTYKSRYVYADQVAR